MLLMYVVPSRELGGAQGSLQLTQIYLFLVEKSVPEVLWDSLQAGVWLGFHEIPASCVILSIQKISGHF